MKKTVSILWKQAVSACLNSDDAHLDMLFNLLEQNIQGWQVGDNYQQRDQLAKAMGSQK